MDLTTGKEQPLAIITGASDGIGYELAKQFAHYGFDLLTIAKTPAVVETEQVCRIIGAKTQSWMIDICTQVGMNEFILKIASLKRSIEAISINIDLNDMNFNIYLLQNLISKIIDNFRNYQNIHILLTYPETSELIGLTFLENIENQIKNTSITFTALSTFTNDSNRKINSSFVAQKVFEIFIKDKDKVTQFQDEKYPNKDDPDVCFTLQQTPHKIKH
jgi:hypothetical protein